jgi:hypothetical protein
MKGIIVHVTFSFAILQSSFLWVNSLAMDSKTLTILDFPKILARLADFCDFSVYTGYHWRENLDFLAAFDDQRHIRYPLQIKSALL